MAKLRILLFGSLEISYGERALPPFPTHRASSLFSFLVVNRGRLFHRDRLAGLFWGDRSDAEARKYLRTEMWRVRTTLKAGGADADRYLLVRDHQIGFDASSDFTLDLQDFDELLNRAIGDEHGDGGISAATLQGAIDLYRGDLLEGYYDDWCIDEQERLRALFLWALERTVRLHAAGADLHRAIESASRLLRYDPLRESIHRDLMWLQYRAGNRAAAVRQFRQCEALLERELEVEPMEETVDLYRRILTERGEAGAPPPERPPATDRRDGGRLATAEAASAEIRQAEIHILTAAKLLERLEKQTAVR